ncbi:hypothetical protein J4E91_007299 [Alternaria rosae]|nr:hypothetical protein J4E91_007299 [Alternaria rosae]
MSERYLSRAKFWKPAPEPYPNVCACIGTEIGVFHDRYWWHAAGPARQQFSLVEPEIVEQLNSVFTERYSSILLFHLYMIGRSRELAVPTIMFFCEQKEPRKKAKKTVDEGGLLGKLPGFRTGHLAELPGLGKLIQPAAGCEDVQRSSEIGLVSEVYFDSAHPVKAIGMPIFVKLPGNTLQKATANIVFEGEDYAYLSVSHIFSGGALPPSITSDTGDSEFDFGSGTEDGDEDGHVDATSRASISSLGGSSDSDSTSSAPSPMSYSEVIPLPSDHSFPNAASLEHLGNLKRYSSEMDWAVIDIQHPDVASAIHRLKDDVSNGNSKANTAVKLERTNVVAHTSRGLITGRLSQEATYMRLPNSKTFQKVYQTVLDSALELGDCGVMILDAISEEPYGHIVVSSTMKEDAYIVSANEVFLRSGTRWEKGLEASSESLNENVSDVYTTIKHFYRLFMDFNIRLFILARSTTIDLEQACTSK